MKELRYCDKCKQITEHKKTILPQSIIYECLDCEIKNARARKR